MHHSCTSSKQNNLSSSLQSCCARTVLLNPYWAATRVWSLTLYWWWLVLSQFVEWIQPTDDEWIEFLSNLDPVCFIHIHVNWPPKSIAETLVCWLTPSHYQRTAGPVMLLKLAEAATLIKGMLTFVHVYSLSVLLNLPWAQANYKVIPERRQWGRKPRRKWWLICVYSPTRHFTECTLDRLATNLTTNTAFDHPIYAVKMPNSDYCITNIRWDWAMDPWLSKMWILRNSMTSQKYWIKGNE